MAFLSLKKILGTEEAALVCGMDEAGRGPWAGPVVTCAFMTRDVFRIKGLKNSKALSAKRREEIAKKLKAKSDYGIGMASHQEIDKLGLMKATNLAFRRAVEKLLRKRGVKRPDILVIDGRDKWNLPIPYKTVIKGDEKIRIVACASILAKVERDRLMRKFSKEFPKYGFENHMGYGTKQHQKAIKEHGVCKIHRKSYKPVARLSKQMEIF